MDEYDEGLLAGDLMHTINNDARNLEAIDNMLQILGINYQFKYGSTPLMIASHNEDYRLVQFLLENGANPNIIKNEDGETALFNGLEDYEITKLLLENGANPFHKIYDKTPYEIAVDDGDDIEIAELLKHYMNIYRIKTIQNMQALQRGKRTRRKLRTSMARKRSALMRGMETKTGPFSARGVRYEPNIMNSISKYLSTMKPSHIDMIDETPYNM
jgi:ankyrin repeat protein